MIRPTIGELLGGVATSLQEEVVPEVPAGAPRRQLEAAITVIRRLAVACEQTGPYPYADNKDIEHTLRGILPALDDVAAKTDAATLAGICEHLRASLGQPASSSDPYPAPDALGARNEELQALLVDIQQALSDPSALDTAGRDEVLAALRALFRRMLEREIELIPEPTF